MEVTPVSFSVTETSLPALSMPPAGDMVELTDTGTSMHISSAGNTIGKIGVIVPTCNRVNWLQEAIESLLVQTYENIEIIVIDNCSSDDTPRYAGTLADSRVVYVRNETNMGVSGSINKAVNMLSDEVEWCTILCDDDYLEKNHIQLMVRKIHETNANSIVHSHIVFVDADRALVKEALHSPPEEHAIDFTKARSEFERDRYLSGLLFKRANFKAMGGFPVFKTGMAADDAMVFVLALMDRLVYCQEAIAYIRVHVNAESQALNDINGHLTALLEYKEYCLAMHRKYGSFDSNTNAKLEKYLSQHICELNTQMWLKCIKNLLKSRDECGALYRRQLYRLGVDKTYCFPLRIRISSYFGLYTNCCPESIGMYRSIWRRIQKLLKQ